MTGPLHSMRGCGICGVRPARRFLYGWRCSVHEPQQPHPDPRFTAVALRERRDRLVLGRRR